MTATRLFGLILTLVFFLLHGMTPAQGACSETPSDLVQTSGFGPCSRCGGWLLPGSVGPSTDSVYTIHSDLPERFLTEGVLYATTPVLPPFDLNNGQPLSEAMRTQVNQGFTTIDDDFEVFVFHISAPGDGSSPRRVTV